MNQQKFISIFASTPIKCIVGEEKDKYLALASLQELKNFIPEIDPSNIDVLPVAFNACIIGRVNKNGDVLDTETGLKMYKHFINKFIDVEHSRTKIVGVIVSASLSEFGTDKPLTEEDVRGKNIPFNITLGGVIWKAVNNELADLIEDAADPSSENYLSCSSSWELGFSDYKVIELPQGEKNLVNPIEVNNEEEKEKLKKYLKCFGGSGIKDGKSYYRMPYQDVIPMGIGLTEKPAADVKGIAVQVTQNQDNIQTKAVTLETYGEKISSQNIKLDVKKDRANIMKINSIADITDENLKQCSASIISDFIQNEITKASKQYETTLAEEKNSKKTLEEKQTSLSQSLAEMQAIVASLSKEKEEREGVDKFNRHMNEVFAAYNLPNDVATVVATDLKDCLSDEAFAKWKARASVYLKPFAKAAVSDMHGGKHEHDEIGIDKKDGKKAFHKSSTESGPEDKIGTSDKQPECDLDNGHHGTASEEEAEAKMTDGPKGGGKDEKTKKKSSTVSGPEDDKKSSKHEKDTDKSDASAIASAVEGALDNGSTEKGGLPNGTSASESKKQKYATAFAMEGFIIK